MTSVAPPTSQSDLLVCRLRQEDKVFDDVLAFKVPVHDDKHQPQSDCHAMVEAEQSALKSTRTIPILDLGFIWLGAAALFYGWSLIPMSISLSRNLMSLILYWPGSWGARPTRKARRP